jgi:predicted amidohydrolase
LRASQKAVITMIRSSVRVAAVQAEAKVFKTNEDFQAHVFSLVASAAQDGAKIVVFPEDVCLWLEMAHDSPRRSALQWISRLSSFKELSSGRRPAMVPALSSANASALPAESLSPPSFEKVPEWRQRIERMLVWLIGLVAGRKFGRWLARTKVDCLYVETFQQAAKENNVVIVGGSVYEKLGRKLAIRCYVFDRDGTVPGHYDKHHLVPAEKCFGAAESRDPIVPIRTLDYLIGACICYDLNFGPSESDPEFRVRPVVQELARNGAQLICAGSTGIRRGPGYPYRLAYDAPQIRRAVESHLAVVRAYQSGWLVQDMLFMDGLSNIVLPDGTIADASFPNCRSQEKLFIQDVPLAGVSAPALPVSV